MDYQPFAKLTDLSLSDEEDAPVATNRPIFVATMMRRGSVKATIDNQTREAAIREQQEPWDIFEQFREGQTTDGDTNTNSIVWAYRSAVIVNDVEANGLRDIRLGIIDGAEYGSVVDSPNVQRIQVNVETIIDLPYFPDQQLLFSFTGVLPAFSPSQGEIPDVITEEIARTRQYDFSDPLRYSVRFINKDGQIVAVAPVTRDKPLLRRRVSIAALASEPRNKIFEGENLRVSIVGKLLATRSGKTGDDVTALPMVQAGSQIIAFVTGRF